MTIEQFGLEVLDRMPVEPTDQQIKLVAALSRFCSAMTLHDSVFVLNGYAGTGKTTVMGALVRTLNFVGIPTVLLASTGRAAKIFANFTGLPAHTIHRKIYRAPVMSADGRFVARVATNPHVNTVFIVDEASMIGDGADGSGTNLLQDLIFYVYSGINCRLILLGDTAQLPPVGMEISPAMDPVPLKEMGLHVTMAVMTKTVRQKQRSGILYNATMLRRALRDGNLGEPHLKVSPFSDIEVVDPTDLEEAFGKSFARYGESETILITRSNRRAVDFNLAIRRVLYDREEALAAGERLIISKNNYYWTRRSVIEQTAGTDTADHNAGRTMDFAANGETAVVEEIYTTEQRELTMFADVRLYFPDHDFRLDAKLNLDTLTTDTAKMPFDRQRRITQRALADAGLNENSSPTAIRNALKADPYYNALQVKYAYAVTCHKAQGGQWASVFVDMGYIPPEAYTSPDFYRWLYTAVTRATTRLWLINPSVAID